MTTPPHDPSHQPQPQPYGPPQPQGYPQGPVPQGPGPQGPYAGPGPYGPPRQPFPQQYPGPHPGPGPGPAAWGGPPMGPPPKKSRTGLIVGIVIGSLVVIGGLGYAAKALVDASGATRAFPEAKYRLTVPKTLLQGEYKLLNDASRTEGKEVEETYDPSVRDAKAAIAQYTGEPGAVLVVSGFHGRLKNPDYTRDMILKGAATEKGIKVVVRPKDFKPEGSDVTVTCQVTRSTDADGTSTLPMCAWGDDNTASFVAVVTPENVTMAPEKVDLAELAETTVKVRAEMRKPIG